MKLCLTVIVFQNFSPLHVRFSGFIHAKFCFPVNHGKLIIFYDIKVTKILQNFLLHLRHMCTYYAYTYMYNKCGDVFQRSKLFSSILALKYVIIQKLGSHTQFLKDLYLFCDLESSPRMYSNLWYFYELFISLNQSHKKGSYENVKD